MQANNCLIYSSKINSVELIRSLAVFGTNSFNLRIFNFVNLLEDINANLGFPIKDKVLSDKELEETTLLFFESKVQLPNPSYQDVQHFLETTKNIRKQIKNPNELSSFKEVVDKNQDNKSLKLLDSFFETYLSSFNGSLDVISYARKIIEYVKKNNVKVYDSISYFEEDDITPLELELLNAVGKNVRKITILSLFENNSKKTLLKSIMPRYGVRNEVAHVLKDIQNNSYPLGECQIVLINKAMYSNELYKFMNNLSVPMSFESGLPINISDAYKLYSSLIQLDKKYFFDVNGYLNVFSSESFDIEKLGIKHPIQVAQILGRMKICFDKNINDEYLAKFNKVKNNHPQEFELILEKIDRELIYKKDEILPEIYNVVNEFSKGLAHIIRQYTKKNTNDDSLFENSVNYLSDQIEYCFSDKVPAIFKQSYLDSVNNKYICAETAKDNAIHITTISKALSSFRKYTYIIGLNSSFYPGSLTEDFLFSDDLYKQLTGIDNFTEKTLNDKNKYLKVVINTYLALGINLSLSFNAQEIKEVRELNPCSVLLDYAEDFFKEANEQNKINNKDDALTQLKKQCSYYDDNLSSLDKIANVAINNDDIKQIDLDIHQKISSGINNRGVKYIDVSYSPSTLPKFLSCPLRFYLDNIVGADNTITYDPLRPMSGNRFGDLFHYVMEHFVKNKPNASKEEIVSYGERLYDIYTSIDRSLSTDDLEKKAFILSIENAYKFLNKNFIISDSKTEQNVGYGEEAKKALIGNIHFRGSIDLVTKDKNGNTIIVDYKTGSHIDHIDDDPSSCIQGLIYAQLYEKIFGENVSKLVFYYTRYDKSVVFKSPCSNEAKNLLLNEVNMFEDALKNLQFGIALPEEQETVCKYCKYGMICHKDSIKEGEDNE